MSTTDVFSNLFMSLFGLVSSDLFEQINLQSCTIKQLSAVQYRTKAMTMCLKIKQHYVEGVTNIFFGNMKLRLSVYLSEANALFFLFLFSF